MNADAEILFGIEGRFGRVHLNQPQRLNALSIEMLAAFRAQLRDWTADPAVAAVMVTAEGDRAFSTGGNLRQLYTAPERAASGAEFYRNAYGLIAAVQGFPKPSVALVDGVAMGGGAGIAINGSHCVVTERALFAMPETGIGLFPDVGAAQFLYRCPGRTGMYLALTGARIQAADLVDLGLADAFVPLARLDDLVAALVAADLPEGPDAGDAIGELIGGFTAEAGPPQLTMHREVMDRAFARNSVPEIIEALCAADGYWAIETADDLEEKSPTSLTIAHRLMREGPAMTFRELMRTEYRLVRALLERDDFFEGIRAAIIDKDRKPRWQPARLADVTTAEIDACFAEPEGGDLEFD